MFTVLFGIGRGDDQTPLPNSRQLRVALEIIRTLPIDRSRIIGTTCSACFAVCVRMERTLFCGCSKIAVSCRSRDELFYRVSGFALERRNDVAIGIQRH